MPEDRTGQTIGGYELGEEIGRGGMAIVYRAHQPQLERWVAIKVLETTGGDKEEFLTRFRREAKAVAALRHPNILTIHDYGEEEGTAFIVMEYVLGGSLKAQLTGQPMEWPETASLMIPVGRALEYAHSRDIIHRDIKPANILLARPDWPLLADFGLAKLLGNPGGITQPGISLGTPAYLSPELAVGDQVDARSDVYGLGVVIYELLTGQVPLQCDSPVETMLRRLRECPPPPSQLNPKVPPEVEPVVMRTLEREPAARYQTMQKLVEDLCQLPGAPGRPMTSSSKSVGGRVTTRLKQRAEVAGPQFCVAATGAILAVPDRDEVLIGRSDPETSQQPEVDLDPYGGASGGVSRRHARLIRRGERWFLVDLESTNGTFINDEQLASEQEAQLHDGDTVRLGSMALVFQAEQD